MKKKQQDHPFFCFKKNCRKTAWDTPDYLNDNDWLFIPKIIAALQSNDPTKLHQILWENYDQAKRFFDHIIGWPEGFIYCREPKYCEVTAFNALKKHELPKLIQALNSHN